MFTKTCLSRSAMLGIVALASLALTAPQAHAGFIATIQQVGSDVVITGSGTINTTALTFELEGPLGPEVFPSDTGFFLGTPYGSVGYYAGTLAGPSSFGGGGSTIGSSSSGSDVGTWGTNNTDPIAVPLGYISGSALSATATFNNTTIASLGITPRDLHLDLGLRRDRGLLRNHNRPRAHQHPPRGQRDARIARPAPPHRAVEPREPGDTSRSTELAYVFAHSRAAFYGTADPSVAPLLGMTRLLKTEER